MPMRISVDSLVDCRHFPVTIASMPDPGVSWPPGSIARRSLDTCLTPPETSPVPPTGAVNNAPTRVPPPQRIDVTFASPPARRVHAVASACHPRVLIVRSTVECRSQWHVATDIPHRRSAMPAPATMADSRTPPDLRSSPRVRRRSFAEISVVGRSPDAPYSRIDAAQSIRGTGPRPSASPRRSAMPRRYPCSPVTGPARTRRGLGMTRRRRGAAP